jgi:hypothetical protein
MFLRAVRVCSAVDGQVGVVPAGAAKSPLAGAAAPTRGATELLDATAAQAPPTGKLRVDNAGTALPVRSEPERGTSSELASYKAARRKLMVELLLRFARRQTLHNWIEQELAHFEDTVVDSGLRAIRRVLRDDKVSVCSYILKRVTK